MGIVFKIQMCGVEPGQRAVLVNLTTLKAKKVEEQFGQIEDGD